VDDVDANARWRALTAKLEARNGRRDIAIRLADEAVEYLSACDSLVAQAECHADRAEVLAAAGLLDEAADSLRRAQHCYEQKGHRPGVRWMRERLAALGDQGGAPLTPPGDGRVC
jgi:tetratricopeptide (TPR) repeat protein